MSKKQKVIILKIIFSLLVALTGFLIQNPFFKIITFLISYLIIGFEVLKKAFKNITKGKIFNEKFLMSVATLGAFAISEYPEAVAVMIFYQIGEIFEHLAESRSEKEISSLMEIRPEFARVLRDSVEVTVKPEEVLVGEIIVVRAGEKIAIDGIVVEGQTNIDSSSLTGESVPVYKKIGDSVLSGCVNLNGVIKIKTTVSYSQSTVSKIVELMESLASNKSKTESFMERFAKLYTPFVVFSAMFLAILPPLFFGNWGDWIYRGLTFLVVSCPCALVVSVPLSFFSGMGNAAKNGVLIKGGDALEKIANANVFVFDKTGTLTTGSFKIAEVCAKECSQKELLSFAAALESNSNHPIARCIAKSVETISLQAENVNEIGGMGIEGIISGERYLIGNERLLDSKNITYDKISSGGATLHIVKENTYLGYIILADCLKEEAKDAVTDLNAKKTVMLTGDNYNTARLVAEQLGIDEFEAGLLPNDKVAKIQELMITNPRLAFVGDGINDAPALMTSYLGIAMGALGSDTAIESADVVIMNDDLMSICKAVKISRKALASAKQNIIFALLLKLLILVLGAAGIANMWLAVFGDVGVTLIAIINSVKNLYIK